MSFSQVFLFLWDINNHPMAGLYIHIPFCKSRCIYCGFYSTTRLNCRQAYTDALCKEMQLREKPMLDTIYLGGGTPSQLTPQQLRQLFHTIAELYHIASDAEVTIECNPDDITPSFVETLSQLPVNRVSMGVQTFDDQRLRFLRRRHTARQAEEAIRLLRGGGITNISIDLMFCFPGQTLPEWDEDITKALSLGVEHISSYSLMIEEDTPLWNMERDGKLSLPGDDLYIMMYKSLVRRLTQAGYEHYEISNFALPGRRSRHNSSYWAEVTYLGIGAAAHSYDGKSRQWNVSDIDKYITSINKGMIPSESETLDPHTRFNDLITTSLRTSRGISLEKVRKEYGDTMSQYLSKQAGRWIESKHLLQEDGYLRLTLSGIMISDTIMSDLVWV